MTTALLATLLAGAIVLAVWLFLQLRAVRARFAPNIDAEAELSRVKTHIDIAIRERDALLTNNKYEKEQLQQEFDRARARYDAVTRELYLLEESLEDISFGIYKPHFDYDTPQDFKNALEGLRENARTMIRAGDAAKCRKTWSVGGSAREGERLMKQYMKLVLRAFNSEADAALANVSWNNILRMEERLKKAFEALNQLGGVMDVFITQQYLDLKLKELRLTYELEQKVREQQEEQRRIREQLRDEERAAREIEKAREEAEQEEDRFERALEKARVEAAKATGEQLEKLNGKIAALHDQLVEAQKQKERAISRAQLTKSGHVYVISNVGSFGEHVYKIGMTRRLDPVERVQELSDASVPFPFDIHAMVYSENAPELENHLQKFFDEKRVNLVNARREFFRVELPEIETFAKQRGVTVEFTKLAEAREYRETVALLVAKTQKPEQPLPAALSTSLFGPESVAARA